MSNDDKAVQKAGKSLPTIKDRLQGDAFKHAIAEILPKHMTPERMARVAIAAMTRTPLLAQCDQASFFAAMMSLSQWGLEPDGRRAHLIPFKNNKTGSYEVQVIIDYKGLVELAMRSGKISRIHADVICENDQFVYDRGEIKEHRIDFRKARGPVYAAYCLVQMKDGSEKCEVMSKEEIESVRKRSRAAMTGPWVSDWNEMAKKTLFRRASKWLQLSAEFSDALEKDMDQLEDKRFQAAKPVFTSTTEPPALFAELHMPEVRIEQPEIPQTESKPDEKPSKPVGDSPQSKLEKAILAEGLTFDQFQAWAKETGEIPSEVDFGTFAELPAALCNRCVKAIVPITKAIKEAK